ncbi:hypothetical protein [Nostoc sp. DedQUE09]|uniref:hypothetical protein n=1 Tax=Nostoc sp. DedQUE09 TaxID=3075394 RepID=UPI002AD1D315|nr:hypothetical protein [Nostoc sp. DedQUE09]MDZ7954755.1 hypothetical protein [Nostoc sp. DedQUE09]
MINSFSLAPKLEDSLNAKKHAIDNSSVSNFICLQLDLFKNARRDLSRLCLCDRR